ncbi:MAG: glutathione peroxidase [Polymorphobacter sp.]
MRNLLTLTAAAVFLVAAAPAAQPGNAFGFTMETIDGKPMPFAQYQGKALLVVNTASFCGYTGQYEGLQKLYETYGPQGLVVIGVPSNDFNQESASNAKIKQFCESKFGIRFPMTESSKVTGPDAAPFFVWAASVMGKDKVPKWNFHKYLVDRDGKLVGAFASKVTPMSPALQDAVKKALATPA